MYTEVHRQQLPGLVTYHDGMYFDVESSLMRCGNHVGTWGMYKGSRFGGWKRPWC